MSSQPPVVVDRVSKDFRLPRERVHTLKERVLHPLRRQHNDVLHALEDVSFVVQPGEFFGIVGRNGSGKSTLLKCLAGIYPTDGGDIYVDGRLSTFIELGVGFNMDLAARDNVLINATMLGLSPREARRRFDRIIEFAELEDFVDLKIKNYSSGMLVRLAFAVMIQVDADILLIDEVLAVGDAAFQQKCFDEFARIRRSGTTVLLVTHDMHAVQRFCDRAMLLEHGHMVEIGEPERVGNRYLELNFSEQARAAEARRSDPSAALEQVLEEQPRDEMRMGDRLAEIVDAWFEDENGERVKFLRTGQQCSAVSRIVFRATVEDPLFGISIHNDQDIKLLDANNVQEEPAGTFVPGDEVLMRISFVNPMAPGRYYLSPAIAHSGGGQRWIDRRDRFISVVSAGTEHTDGIAVVPYEFGLARDPSHVA